MENYKVLNTPVMSRKERVLYMILILMGIASSLIFAVWWFQPQHVPHNFTGYSHFWDILLFFTLSYIVWYQIINELFYWLNAFYMRKVLPTQPESGLSVAFLTAFVPQNEPYDVLERNLKAMVAVDYPHDTWLLDEGNDPIAKTICKKYGVHHFSRKGIPQYNMDEGEFKQKTKGGNYNSWFDKHGLKYHIVAQVDVDFIPKKNFLTETLGILKIQKLHLLEHRKYMGTNQIHGLLEELQNRHLVFMDLCKEVLIIQICHSLSEQITYLDQLLIMKLMVMQAISLKII